MTNHIQTLQRFNAWISRADVIEKPTLKQVTESINYIIETHAELQTELAEARAELAIAKTKENQ